MGTDEGMGVGEAEAGTKGDVRSVCGHWWWVWAVGTGNGVNG